MNLLMRLVSTGSQAGRGEGERGRGGEGDDREDEEEEDEAEDESDGEEKESCVSTKEEGERMSERVERNERQK